MAPAEMWEPNFVHPQHANLCMTNKDKLLAAYLNERQQGHAWHDISKWLFEHQVSKDEVLESGELTTGLIEALPSLRVDKPFTFNGTGKELPTEASKEKSDYYQSPEWELQKRWLWLKLPHICPYCGYEMTQMDFTAHHKLFLEGDTDTYENDDNPEHYTLMHIKCHHAAHEILKTSFDPLEISKLDFMGSAWTQAALAKIYKENI